jgi:peptidyl-tRNA hydrolase
MITQEDIDAFSETSSFKDVKRDIERSLHDANSARHWLHETDPYESKELDKACEHFNQAIALIKGVIDKNA